mmetsp:Transcript_1457/g.3911  ORF Transcript_1457/g.3911 Transcript_1457/m.3911 type:complete len:346 (+) Transcript_1457:67-1104(+)
MIFPDVVVWIVGYIATFTAVVGLVVWLVHKLVVKAGLMMKVKDIPAKHVLITGCDTGFGRMASVQLARRGFHVHAACLFEKSVDDLQKEGLENLHPFSMDVTKDESVEAGYTAVCERLPEAGLWAIINNAGVLRGGHLELCSIADWKLCFDVNVIGVARTTHKFFKLLRQNPTAAAEAGRIVNVASVAGVTALSKTSAYCGSKFAVQGLSDSWRRECKAWRVRVVKISPGIMKTPLYDAPFDRAGSEEKLAAMGDELRDSYGVDHLEKAFENTRKLVDDVGGNPQDVVDTMELAVSASRPPPQMFVGKDTPVWEWLARLPTCVSDYLLFLNEKKNLPAGCRKYWQ